MRVQLQTVSSVEMTIVDLADMTGRPVSEVSEAFIAGNLTEWLDTYCTEALEDHVSGFGRESTTWDLV